MERGDYWDDKNNDEGEYDLIPGDNDYPSDETYGPDAPANLCHIPEQGVTPQGDTAFLPNVPIVIPSKDA